MAWQAAFAYLEETACATRRGRNGIVREPGAGFVASAFAHRTSRALDPHLHTHVIVANAAQSPDGTWRALDGDLLLRTHRLAAGSLYQAQLRYELTTRLGVDWQPGVKGMAEIQGIPDAALHAFSTRRQQVVAHLAEHATMGWHAAQVAAVATRDSKSTPDLAELRREWSRRAAEYGFGPDERRAVLGRTRWRPLSASEQRAEALRLLSEVGLSETRATFNDADLVAAWAAASPHGASAQDVCALAREFANDARVVELDAEPPLAGIPRRYTTTQLASIERHALALALAGRASGAPAVSPDQADPAVDEHHPELSTDQRAMIAASAGSPDRVVCVVGHAGAGKTTALRALHHVLAEAGINTLGAAPSGVAAEKLEQETAIPSSTLHRLVGDADRVGLPRRSVVVVDEAAMADTRTLHRLLEHATHAQAKVVLVGDDAQLGAVGPGGLYAALVEQLGATSLTANHRQHDPAEREALRALRDGGADDYLAYAARRGRLTLADTPDEARAALLADWHAAQATEPDTLMIAHRRIDVEALNDAARVLLRRDGRLGEDRHTTPEGRGFAIGDQVLCLQNAPALGVVNGTRGELVDIRQDRITLRTPSGERHLPQSYADEGFLTHGFALTGHKSQGQTVERAFVLAPDRGDLKEWAYVAASRARQETRIYLAATSLDPERHAPVAPATHADAVERLATAATRPANERLATDTPARTLPQLVEQREAVACALDQARRDARTAERALTSAGPIRRRTRGPKLALIANDARTRVASLREEAARLDAAIRARRLELAERQRARRLDQPRPTRSLDRGPDMSIGR